jgi:hypothetical protein
VSVPVKPGGMLRAVPVVGPLWSGDRGAARVGLRKKQPTWSAGEKQVDQHVALLDLDDAEALLETLPAAIRQARIANEPGSPPSHAAPAEGREPKANARRREPSRRRRHPAPEGVES